MSYCMSACKEILRICEEARMRGKSIIRITKIENLVDEAVALELEAYSNTGSEGNNKETD